MKHAFILYALLALCFSVNNATAEVLVSNVQARQLDRPSKIVEITYDVEADAETVFITLEMSMNSGESWDAPIQTVEGDIGEGIEPGQDKRILWDAGTDFPNQVSNRMQARVTANDSGEPQEGGTPFEIEISMNQRGEDAGGGAWMCMVGLRCWDRNRNPAGNGMQVMFTVEPEIANIEPARIQGGVAQTWLIYSSAHTFSPIEISATLQVPQGMLSAALATILPLNGGELSLMVDPESWMFDDDNPEARIRVWTILRDGHGVLINNAPILFTSTRGRFYWFDFRGGRYMEFFPDPARKLTGVRNQNNNESPGQATVFLIAREQDIFLDQNTLELPVQINAVVEGYEEVAADPEDVLFLRHEE